MTKSECFSIDISVLNGKDILNGQTKHSVFRFPKRTALSLFHPAIMIADPFLLVKNGIVHLFYEEMLLGKGLGCIKTIFSDDLIHWSKPKTIISVPNRHFSYPFVFEHEDKVFIMPESGDTHNICLYKADDKSLTSFSFYKEVIKREKLPTNLVYDFADSCIYEKDNIFYLFTSYCDDKTYYLELYTSNRFDGDYKLHPQSPICISNKYGRCGGNLIESGNRIYRPAQDCEIVYGGQLHLMEIDEITPNSYREHLEKENFFSQNKGSIYREGGHHINMTRFGDSFLIATDFRFTTSFLLERARLFPLKILKKIFS